MVHSVEGVLDWEGDSGSTEELEAGVHHKTIIIVEDESPSSHVPASGEGIDSVVVNEPVPDKDGKVFDKSHIKLLF